MAFTVQDFRDLVRVLEAHPEWRAELRRLVLTEELLELPTLVRELAEAQRRTEGAIEELTRAQLALVTEQSRMNAEQERMRGQFDRMRGDLLEIRYRNHAGAYFGPLVSRARVLQDQELTTLLDDARDAGVIGDAGRVDALLAELVVRGRRREDGTEVYLVVEVSVGIGPDDVRRAADRAAFIGKVQDAVPVVAGERITEDAHDLAAARGVWTVLDGRATPPAGRA